MLAHLVATARDQKTLQDDDKTPARIPLELQVGWMMRTWGIGIMGPDPDFRMIMQADRALTVHDVFKRLGEKDGISNMTRGGWKVVSETEEKIREWLAKQKEEKAKRDRQTGTE